MPNRVIRDGINTSKRVNVLSCGAELFYRRLLLILDDYGRFYGHPATLRTGCWPTCPGKHTDAEIEVWLEELTAGDRPLISMYENDGCHYVQVSDFGQRIQARSRFPEPLQNAPTVLNGVPPCKTVVNGSSPYSTAPRARANEGVDEVVDEDVRTVRARDDEKTVSGSDVDETGTPPPPTPKRTRRKPPAAEAQHRTGVPPPEVSSSEGVGNAVAVVRASLSDLASRLRMPAPDDQIVRQVVAAARGATGEAIHDVIRGLYHQRKFDRMRSWGLLPVVVGPWFTSHCSNRIAVEEHSPDYCPPQDETQPDPPEETPVPPKEPTPDPEPSPEDAMTAWLERRAELQGAGDFAGVRQLDEEYFDRFG